MKLISNNLYEVNPHSAPRITKKTINGLSNTDLKERLLTMKKATKELQMSTVLKEMEHSLLNHPSPSTVSNKYLKYKKKYLQLMNYQSTK